MQNCTINHWRGSEGTYVADVRNRLEKITEIISEHFSIRLFTRYNKNRGRGCAEIYSREWGPFVYITAFGSEFLIYQVNAVFVHGRHFVMEDMFRRFIDEAFKFPVLRFSSGDEPVK